MPSTPTPGHAPTSTGPLAPDGPLPAGSTPRPAPGRRRAHHPGRQAGWQRRVLLLATAIAVLAGCASGTATAPSDRTRAALGQRDGMSSAAAAVQLADRLTDPAHAPPALPPEPDRRPPPDAPKPTRTRPRPSSSSTA